MTELSARNISLRSLYDRNRALDESHHLVMDVEGFPDSLKNVAYDAITSIIDYYPHRVVSGDAIDALSKKYYQTERLYWVIMVYNGIHDFRKVHPGTLLRIPTDVAVKQVLTSVSSTNVQARVIII